MTNSSHVTSHIIAICERKLSLHFGLLRFTSVYFDLLRLILFTLDVCFMPALRHWIQMLTIELVLLEFISIYCKIVSTINSRICSLIFRLIQVLIRKYVQFFFCSYSARVVNVHLTTVTHQYAEQNDARVRALFHTISHLAWQKKKIATQKKQVNHILMARHCSLIFVCWTHFIYCHTHTHTKKNV